MKLCPEFSSDRTGLLSNPLGQLMLLSLLGELGVGTFCMFRQPPHSNHVLAPFYIYSIIRNIDCWTTIRTIPLF